MHPAATLLEVLREHLGVRSPKDGCSPQGQCGCCTVWVDGQPRVACVTPAARVEGREVTTLEGLPEADRTRWADAFTATGASQCGFCTPGIVMRLEGARRKGVGADDRRAVDQALAAHLCRCTGWQTIREAYARVAGGTADEPVRDLVAAAQRATLEGGAAQVVGPAVVAGEGGFAEDTAPLGTPVAVRTGAGEWARGATLGDARRAAAKVQGRRSTVGLRWPLEPPPGDWDVVLCTTWVEPAYLEPDASWWIEGGGHGHPLANGGAFGGKADSPVLAEAEALAVERAHAEGGPAGVRVVWSREDVVRWGPKRPPIAAGLHADGRGVVRVVRTPGVAAAIRAVLPAVEVEEVEVAGPATSMALRAAGWAEAAVLRAVLDGLGTGAPPDDGVEVAHPGGGRAHVALRADGPGGAEQVHVTVWAGAPLDTVVLRSYCIGAVHQALGWVRREGVAVDDAGDVQDLTIRSFGVLRPADVPVVHVHVVAEDGPARPVSDAVFAATAAAAWRAAGLPARWPVDRR